MGRVSIDDLSKYSSGNNARFFKLKDDGDSANVRFMINDVDDMNDYLFSVHKIEIGESFRYVNCLREYNDSLDVCPLCASGNRSIVRLFLPLYDNDDDMVKLWDRSKAFVQKMTSLCGRYPDLVSHCFDVERNGKARDMKTTYEIYNTDNDDTTLDDLPEIPDVLGVAVLDKTVEDMEYFLEEKQFPPDDDDEDEEGPRRRSRTRERDEDDEEVEEERPRNRERSTRHEERERRTPARNRKKSTKEDKF